MAAFRDFSLKPDTVNKVLCNNNNFNDKWNHLVGLLIWICKLDKWALSPCLNKMEAGNWSGQNINDSKYLETGLIIKTKLGKGIMKGFTDHIISLVIFFKFFCH